jgi:hypothetical protein
MRTKALKQRAGELPAKTGTASTHGLMGNYYQHTTNSLLNAMFTRL